MSILPRVLGAYRREGWLGIPRGGGIKLLKSVALLADSWSERLERSAGVHDAEDRSALAKNAILRNRHRGQRCFIIGNGPSLQGQDLSPLSGEVTLAMSAFWKYPLVERCQPTYYCLADPLFFDGSGSMQAFFTSMVSRIHSGTFLVPLSARHIVQAMSLLPPERTHFAAFRGSLAHGLSDQVDFTNVVPGVQSVSQMAILAALYMGCSPIYLLGLDHDWLAQRGMDRHFYSGLTVEGHPLAHGDLDRSSYGSDLKMVLKLWNGYEHLHAYALSEGVEIVNATLGGFLDVFPRVEYESVLAPAR